MKRDGFVRSVLALATRMAGALRRVFKRVSSPGSGPFVAGC